jgi:hypothetical protein
MGMICFRQDDLTHNKELISLKPAIRIPASGEFSARRYSLPGLASNR